LQRLDFDSVESLDMRTLQLLSLALLATAAWADSMLIQDVDGVVSVITTSPRMSLGGISAPPGMVFAGSDIPDEGDFGLSQNVAFPGGLFIATSLGTSTSNPSTFLALSFNTWHPGGPPLPCGMGYFNPCYLD